MNGNNKTQRIPGLPNDINYTGKYYESKPRPSDKGPGSTGMTSMFESMMEELGEDEETGETGRGGPAEDNSRLINLIKESRRHNKDSIKEERNKSAAIINFKDFYNRLRGYFR
ncbi:hypothetical protein GF336_07590 [Candidatus Woesearchaeota archaeon]|nr:hypothetical protein [Candidatus Woesearchaeota archaeon]